MNNRFTVLLQWILKWEGSEFTNDPDDRGGATRYGVIQSRYDEYRKMIGKPIRSVAMIEMAEVKAIYKSYYWDAIKGDSLPVPLDLALFNVAVNSGPARAQKWHTELDATDSPLDAARSVCDRYETFYRLIVARDTTQAKFLRGWLNRLNDCRHEIEEAAQRNAEGESETWTLLLGQVPLGPAWANPADGARAYFPARRLIEAVMGTTATNANLSVVRGQVCWNGRAVPVKEVEREPGQMWIAVRDTATWLGLDVLVDGKERSISLIRPAGAAKAL